ncbi:MAG: hypothetical protein ACFCUO_05835 [Rhodospirillales bacterium]
MISLVDLYDFLEITRALDGGDRPADDRMAIVRLALARLGPDAARPAVAAAGVPEAVIAA